MPLSLGTPAPEFELQVVSEAVPPRLADYKGERKAVLTFSPLAFSSICTAQMCEVA